MTFGEAGHAGAAAYLAMLAEHQRLGTELAGRAAAVCGMVLAGLPHEAALVGLVACLNEDLLPRAMAEEESLYPAAVRAGLIGAVAELTAEHGALSAAAARLADATGRSAASRAREIVAMFTAHAGNEDRVLREALFGELRSAVRTVSKSFGNDGRNIPKPGSACPGLSRCAASQARSGPVATARVPHSGRPANRNCFERSGEIPFRAREIAFP
jgi:hypothetical protein